MSTFHDILQNGYSKNKRNDINGFQIDRELSNNDHQVYHHKDKGLLYNVTGTQNSRDWINNLKLATGIGYKKTKRYSAEKESLSKAKQKYGVDNAILTGHSQAGALTSFISDPNKDKVFNLDKAATIGHKSRKNETNYASRGDIVSVFNDNNKYIGSHDYNFLNAHKVDKIKNLPDPF